MKKFFFAIILLISFVFAACAQNGQVRVSSSGSGTADLTGAEGDAVITDTRAAASATPATSSPPAATAPPVAQTGAPPVPSAPPATAVPPTPAPPVAPPALNGYLLPGAPGGGWQIAQMAEGTWIRFRQNPVPSSQGYNVYWDNNSDQTSMPYHIAIDYRSARHRLYPCNGDARDWVPVRDIGSRRPIMVLPAGTQTCMTIPRDECVGGCTVRVNVTDYTPEPPGGYVTEMRRRVFTFHFPMRHKTGRQPLE